MAIRRSNRRGVLLLVVLSLLVLFVLIGATFMIVADQYNRSSKVAARQVKKKAIDPAEQLDSVAIELLAGTDDESSPLHRHGLLDDLYGNDGFRGSLSNWGVSTNNSVVIPNRLEPGSIAPTEVFAIPNTEVFAIRFVTEEQDWPLEQVGEGDSRAWPGFLDRDFDNNQPDDTNPRYRFLKNRLFREGLGLEWSQYLQIRDYFVDYRQSESSKTTIKGKNYYAGCILTFEDGVAAGQSFRILQFDPPIINQSGAFSGKILRNVEPQYGPNGEPNPNSFPIGAGTMLIENLAGIDVSELRDSDSFIVNGRPFSGTGLGYNPATKNLDTRAREFNQDAQVSLANRGITGVGFLPEVALMPNYQFAIDPVFANSQTWKYAFEYPFSADVGGMDESWDVADYQNMFLAEPPKRAELREVTSTMPVEVANRLRDLNHEQLLDTIGIPSFHRPFLINNWVHRLGNWTTNPLTGSTANLLSYWTGNIPNDQNVPRNGQTQMASLQYAGQFRKNIITRPMPDLHPLFDGSNPAFSANRDRDGDRIPDCIDPDVWDNASWNGAAYTTHAPNGGDGLLDNLNNGILAMPAVMGPWDVDNDGDGIMDSVWVDLGAPIETTPEGRQYKPLFALMCIDLDGRINLNAHGSLANFQFQRPNVYGQVAKQFGQGYGPAEISLWNVLKDSQIAANGDTTDVFSALSVARYDQILAMRLRGVAQGSSMNGAHSEVFPIIPQPGNNTANPRVTDELFNYMSELGMPNDYINQWRLFRTDQSIRDAWPNRNGSNYSTPPNLLGLRSLTIDINGQPLYRVQPGVTRIPETINDPYEANLLDFNPYDSHFTVAELESILRRNDYSSFSQLRSRLTQQLPVGGQLIPYAKERLFTTRQSHIPLPEGPQFLASIDDSNVRDPIRNQYGETIPIPPNPPEEEYNIFRHSNGEDPRSFLQLFESAMDREFDADLALYNDNQRNEGSDGYPRRSHFPEYIRLLSDTHQDRWGRNRLNREIWKKMQMFRMLPATVRNGQKMDINWPIGNGLDDDHDGIVDDPTEVLDALANQFDDDGDAFMDTQDPDEGLLASNLWPEFFGGGENGIVGSFLPGSHPTRLYSDGTLRFIGDYTPFTDRPPRTMQDVLTTVGDRYRRIDFPITDYQNNNYPMFWKPMIGGFAANGQFIQAPSATRQMMARYLYVIAMVTLKDYQLPIENLEPEQLDALKAQKLAQWAINVVDFRDPDSIMTPFEFDMNPFDGWDVDGVIVNTVIPQDGVRPEDWERVAKTNDEGQEDPQGRRAIAFRDQVQGFGETRVRVVVDDNDEPFRGLVWGLEQPELIITETLALHNKRLRDLDTDTGERQFMGDPANQNDQAGPGEQDDDDLDQYRKPEGSLFIELYCPRNAGTDETSSELPNELYWKNPNIYQQGTENSRYVLDLGKANTGGTTVQAADPDQPVAYPVWRIVLSRQTEVYEQAVEQPQGANFVRFEDIEGIQDFAGTPDSPTELMKVNLPSFDQFHFENRFVWFSSANRTGQQHVLDSNLPSYFRERVYWNRNAVVDPNDGDRVNHIAPVHPGGFALVAPRWETEISSQNDFVANIMGKEGRQWIRLVKPNQPSPLWQAPFRPVQHVFRAWLQEREVPQSREVYYDEAEEAVGTLYENKFYGYATPMIAAANVIAVDGGGEWRVPDSPEEFGRVGLSVSEPLPFDYYREPNPDNDPQLDDDELGYLPRDTYRSAGGQVLAIDTPYRDDKQDIDDENDDIEFQEQTYETYVVAYLQRLANPTLGWNPRPAAPGEDDFHDPNRAVNPYVTVDAAPVDLCVYNGELSLIMKDIAELPDDDQESTATREYELRSRERSANNLWGSAFSVSAKMYGNIFPSGINDADSVLPTEIEDDELYDTVRTPVTTGLGRIGILQRPNQTRYIRPLNDDTIDVAAVRVENAPSLPYPWITWNNRPYMSQYELLQVPGSSADRLFFEFPLTATGNQYLEKTSKKFGHLPNFFGFFYDKNQRQALDGSTQDGLLQQRKTNENFFALVENFEVPSRFVGTRKWLDPRRYQMRNLVNNNQLPNIHSAMRDYAAPFNWLPNYREPGRININTIKDWRVWDSLGLSDATDPDSTTWHNIVNSRLGTNTVPDNATRRQMYLFPSRYSNPFRASGSANMMPPSLRTDRDQYTVLDGLLGNPNWLDNYKTNNPDQVQWLDAEPYRSNPGLYPWDSFVHTSRGFPVDATIMRREAFVESLDDGTPVTEPDPITGIDRPKPESTALFERSSASSALRYDDLNRLSNFVTNHSNVYAVWITVGYFEVLPWNPQDPFDRSLPAIADAAHPDGFQLGKEIGIDSGGIQRHRAFYIIDRSIPVGFERGRAHNVENAILLKRFID